MTPGAGASPDLSVADRAAAIFLALSRVAPADREPLLREQCGADIALRAEVDRLLASLDQPDSLLDTPPPGASFLDDEIVAHPAGSAIGDFVLVRQIGAGGTGVVYLAHQRHPARIVALKLLRRQYVASVVQRRFEVEAELLAHLHHPGIAQIYAAHPGDETTPPYIAMELVNGPPLTEYAESRQLSIADRVALVAQACDAVQHAHQRGIIHRDLKPGNILVNEDGVPKVLDFGVARRTGNDGSETAAVRTETGQLLGTLAYMSPEQVQASPDAIDTRTDIHALGVILFRLLTGRLPYAHDDPPFPELARRIMRDEPPRLGSFDDTLRGDLEVIVARALAKEKDRRYASAAGLANDLRRYLAGQPISASADSAWYLVRRQIRRYRLALGLSVAASVVLTALASYALVQRARAQQLNVQLEDSLAASTIERGRLVSLTGNLPIAEELVWRELFRRPDSRHAQWALWDIYAREPSMWSALLHQNGAQTAQFMPGGSDTLLTAGRVDGRILFLDVASGQVRRTFSADPRGGLRRVLATSDRQSLVSMGEDGTLRAWDVPSGRLRREIPAASSVNADLALLDHDRSVVVGSPGSGVQVWSLAGGVRTADLSSLADRVIYVAASRDGDLVVTGSQTGIVTAIDVATRRRRWQAHAHDGPVSSVRVSPDQSLVVSGGDDGRVQVWRAGTGELARTILTDNSRVRNMAFTSDSARLLIAGPWRVRIFDLADPLQPPRDVGPSEGSSDIDISADGARLATCNGSTGQVRVWDLTADARRDRWSIGRSPVTGLVPVSGGDGIVTSGVDGELSWWRRGQREATQHARTGADVTSEAAAATALARASGLAISRNGKWLVTVGGPSAGGAVWDARDGRRLAELPDAGPARAVSFVDDDRHIVVGEADGSLATWDWSEAGARNLRRQSTPHGEVMWIIAHGSRYFVSHRERVVSIRDATTGLEERWLRASASPFSLAISPDGRLLAAGTWVGAVDLWDAETGAKLDELKGQTALATALDFNPRGDLLVVASRDGSTRLWDVAARQFLATVAQRKWGAERTRFLPDGRTIAVGYQDGEIEMIDLDYYFRFAAGHVDYQLGLLRNREPVPRADAVRAWAQRILAAPGVR